MRRAVTIALLGLVAAFPPAPVEAASGARLTPGGSLVLVSKDVGAERWAIAYDEEAGVATGNVFTPGGGTPRFVWCERSHAGSPAPARGGASEVALECFGADPCLAAPCLASAWEPLGQVTVPAGFFAPPPARAVGFRRFTLRRSGGTAGTGRDLDTFLWYPAAPGASGETAFGGVEDAPVAPGGPFPLVLFSHGSCSFPGAATFLTVELARLGFAVAAPSHPGNTFAEFPSCADPAAVAEAFVARPDDVEFTLDRLLERSAAAGDPIEGAIDAGRIGASGWSFGGQTALQVAGRDGRIAAVLALAPAGVAFAAVDIRGIGVPAMIVGAELDSLAPFEVESRPAFDLLRPPRFLAEILNAGHFAFADTCSPGPEPIGEFPDCAPGTLSQDEAHALVLRVASPFLRRYVAGEAGAAAELEAGGLPAGLRLTADPG